MRNVGQTVHAPRQVDVVDHLHGETRCKRCSGVVNRCNRVTLRPGHSACFIVPGEGHQTCTFVTWSL
ncbi:hypothetical protein RRG08_028859 [Elysia crispata]|uniref:Uncharacterized protein n=1 Tax=Elysia crispata TaxID=231223 RepID=A0AAE1D770_9GAST|nr:hypothetical protein RRG08_028859 [Elysia crispata]